MEFKIIDLENWERAECFQHFSTVAKSTYSLTAEVDITNLMKYIRKKGLRLFPTFTWLVTYALNQQEVFRMGYDENGNLGIWDEIYPDYSVLNEKTKNMDSLCTPYESSFALFYEAMCRDTKAYKEEGKGTKKYPNFFVASCLPWLKYTSFTATNESSYTFLFPMVTWGKYVEVQERVIMPLTLQIHHAAADGYHCAKFFQQIDEMISNLEYYLENHGMAKIQQGD